MANFVFENYNSMPEQVEENKKNIKEIIKYIKPVYNTQTSLTTSTISIAIASTNAPSDATNGWLLDENGLLFHITSGDGTNLLLEYYANIKGQQGIQGIPGTPGTPGTPGPSGRSVVYSSENFTIGQYTYTLSYLNFAPQVNDVIIFANGYMGSIISISTTQYVVDNLVLMQKPRYEHNITIKSHGGSWTSYITLTITNDDNTPFDYSKLLQYLIDNNFTYQKIKGVYGSITDSNNSYSPTGIYTMNNAIYFSYVYLGTIEFNSQILNSGDISIFNDNIIEI